MQAIAFSQDKSADKAAAVAARKNQAGNTSVVVLVKEGPASLIPSDGTCTPVLLLTVLRYCKTQSKSLQPPRIATARLR